MDQAAIRNLTSQLADDLSWLEKHGQTAPEQTAQLGVQRLAAAMVRNVIGPALEGQQAAPLHLAVVGGAGAGKSTITNMLSGSVLAEANPQAGFTRHPIAYTSSNDTTSWASHLGFLGPLRRLTTPAPSSLDEDVYQVRKVPATPGQFSLLDHFVIWDCPDMTTFAASNYVSRMMEVAGLADVLVYVASDERYNDAVPSQFLRLFLEAGKAVIAVVTKMRPENAQKFLEHFHEAVLADMPAPVVASLAVPQLSYEQLGDPVTKAMEHRIPLLNQVSIFASAMKKTRQRSASSAMNYLKNHQSELMGVAKGDLVVLEDWRSMVGQGEAEFILRYRREFLDAERFPRFDEASVRLLDLLEFPGMDKVVKLMRAPVQLAKGLLFRAMQRPEAPMVPEKPVLEGALAGWIDALRKESARRGPTHPAWAHIARGFSSGMVEQVHKQFDASLKNFHVAMNAEVERTARAIYEDLEKSPVSLNTLRSGKLAMTVGAIGVGVYSLGMSHILWNLLVAPVLAAATNQIVDVLGNQYVESQRAAARIRQEILVRQQLANPLAERFIQWPITGGSPLERLSLVLRRIPEAIGKIELLVCEKLQA